MQTLQELIYIVTKNKLSAIGMVGSPCGGRPTKMDKLYEGVITQEFEDDIEAAQGLYGSDPQNPSYQGLLGAGRINAKNALECLNGGGSRRRFPDRINNQVCIRCTDRPRTRQSISTNFSRCHHQQLFLAFDQSHR